MVGRRFVSNALVLGSRGFSRIAATCAVLALVGCGGSSSGGASGVAVNLAWDAPTEDANGLALVDLAGYRVYEGATTTNLAMIREVHDTVTNLTVTLPTGTHYLAVTAYDDQLNESDLSNTLAVTISDTGEIQLP